MTVVAASFEEPVANARLLPETRTHQHDVSGQLRYIIDNHPATYEATPVSFSF